MKKLPGISIVIPIFNEEAILDTAVRALVSRLDKEGLSYELILAENGSRDQTVPIARTLAAEIPNLRLLHIPEPNYGRALRAGIESACGRWVICDEIDLGDLDFYRRALGLLESGADMVVGSKRHPESQDARPWLRRQGTMVINTMLRVSLGFDGSDTHGLKAFNRERLLAVVDDCVVEHNLFASELVIRAGRAGFDVREIPLHLREIRPPSVGLVRRIPHVVGDLARLVYVIRFRG
ncbi:MAG: glycosyltransferase family 2 protein [Myxococcota bacterium]